VRQGNQTDGGAVDATGKVDADNYFMPPGK
jgi:hypothetical protein